MPECGSQCILCGLPVRFDTYSGCSHGCKYCFAQKKGSLQDIKVHETVKALAPFVAGKRTKETNWCDWSIPLHWGGLSDPFQPAEKKYRVSYECLKLLAETQYPFVVSTKGRLVVEPEYLDLLERCNCVVQISMVCSEYDVLEPGAPSFEERLEMVRKLAHRVKRVNIRIQPYMTEVFSSVMENIRRFREAGAHGVIVEGMKFLKRKPGLVKVGGDYAYKQDTLKAHYEVIRDEAHANRLAFYCGENRLRGMGDDLTCCGIDGLNGFTPNEFNLCHLINGKKAEPTIRMQEPGTARCFQSLKQTAASHRELKDKSFSGCMLEYYSSDKEYIKRLFGK